MSSKKLRRDLLMLDRFGLKSKQLNLFLYFSRDLGKKMYELSNHLGNVQTTISDRRIAVPYGSNLDHYITDVISSTDYYPFGSAMPGRNSNSDNYRFGFNGQEMDNEISGQTGTHTTAMFWEYDTRLGRRWNLDPKPTASVSRYACFNGNPIWFSDPLGDTVRYEKFRDRITTGISRLFNRDFNERVKGWKSETNTYTIGARENHSRLSDAKPEWFTPLETDKFQVHYSMFGSNSTDNSGSWGIPLEWNTHELHIGGQKLVERKYHRDFQDINSTMNQFILLRRRVPNTEITVNAHNIPDLVTVADITNSTTISGPVLLGGPGYVGTQGRSIVLTPITNGRIVVSITSQSNNAHQTLTIPSDNTPGFCKSGNTDGSVWYWRYTGLKLSIKLPF